MTVQQKSTAILQFVTLTSPDGRYDSLFLANYATINLQDRARRACPASATSTSSAPASIRMRVWLDPEQAAGALAHPAGRDQRAPGAEPAGRPPASSACRRRRRRSLPVHASTSPAASTRSSSSRTSSSRPTADGADDASARRRPRRARRADLQPGLHAERQAGGRHRHLSRRSDANALDGGRARSSAKMAELAKSFPARADLHHPVRHHDLRQGLDQRGLQDAVRGRRSWC